MSAARSVRLSAFGLATAAMLTVGCAGSDVRPSLVAAALEDESVSTPASAEAVLVAADYEPPKNRIDSTGAYIPGNGKPTLVFVDAIWCFFCALARPAVAKLRPEYQDRINFVILDFDLDADLALAERLGVAAHPAYALIPANQHEPARKWFGPTPEEGLRARIRDAIDQPVVASR